MLFFFNQLFRRRTVGENIDEQTPLSGKTHPFEFPGE